MTATAVNTRTMANGLVSVYTALKLSTRADGSSYRALSETHPDYEAVRSIVYDLHEGELPNDWRYDTIYNLASGLLEYQDCPDDDLTPWGLAEFTDCVPSIADDLVDICAGDLLEWAKIGSRLEFWEEPWGSGDITKLLQMRQREEIETMACNLLVLVGEHFT